MPWLFSKFYKEQHPEKVKEIKARFTKNYLSRNSKAFERQMVANTSHDMRGLLHGINMPTLIMVGKDDELTPPRVGEELKSEIPGARLLIFEKGGHGLYWEIPWHFNEAVLDFLGRV